MMSLAGVNWVDVETMSDRGGELAGCGCVE